MVPFGGRGRDCCEGGGWGGGARFAPPPVWLEEGSMSKTDEYRQIANDCIVWARIATSDDQRDQFLELAKKWMSDAESIDQGIELRPNNAAKASEMAGGGKKRMGCPVRTSEQRPS